MKKYIPGAILVALILVGIGFIASSNPDRLGAQVLSPIVINPIIAPIKIPTRCDPAKPITITVDPSSPAGGTYTAGAKGNDFGHFKITANCDVNITQLSVAQDSGATINPEFVGEMYSFYAGATLLDADLTGGISNSNGYFRLAAGQSKVITVKIDLAPQNLHNSFRIALGVVTYRTGSTTPFNSGYFSTPWAAFFKILPGGTDNPKLLLMGGATGNPSSSILANDIFGSHNGSTWFQIDTDTNTGGIQNARWSPRSNQRPIFFNGKYWLIGGNNNSMPSAKEVWSSSDGIGWQLVVSNTPWSERSDPVVQVFNNKMWVIGGQDIVGSGPIHEVWSSSDGINWVLVTSSAPLIEDGAGSVVFNNKIWLIGGHIGYSRVWSSSDGINWVLVTGSAPWSYRSNHLALVFNNKMWIIGGCRDGASYDDIWSSIDGVNWIQEVANAPWEPGCGYQAALLNGKIFIFGGLEESLSGANFSRSIWSSSDGVNWQPYPRPVWSSRALHSVIVR